MKKFISFAQAVKLATSAFVLLLLFHLVIVLGILFFDFVPLDFLWGGRMSTQEELLVFETLSLVIAGLCLLVVLIRSDRVHLPALRGVSRFALWILTLLFLLNTAGNMMAKTAFERSFTVVTLFLAVLCLRMAVEPLQKK